MKVGGNSFSGIKLFKICLLILCVFFSINTGFAQESNSTPIPLDDRPINVNTNLITFNVSVTDSKGFAVAGLNKNNFTVFDNKVSQEINFFSDEDSPASISIVFDTSGSMSGAKIELAKKSLADFIQTSKEQDEFFLVDVNSKAKLLLSRTRDSEAVLEKLNNVRANGNTALYDAIFMGIENAGKGAHAKKIVLVISDGEDNNSRLSFRKLKESLKESEAIVYSIGIDDSYPTFSKGLSGRNALMQLASVSGGKSYFPENAEELTDIFDRIALDIRRLYAIGYYSNELPSDGKNHRITVKVKPPDDSTRLTVHSRKEYKPEPIVSDR